MVAVVLGEHLLSADGADQSLYYQAALADFLVTVGGDFQQDNLVDTGILTVQQCPEVGQVIQFAVIAGVTKVCLAGCQYGIVIGYRDQLFDFHFSLPHFIKKLMVFIFVLFVTHPHIWKLCFSSRGI